MKKIALLLTLLLTVALCLPAQAAPGISVIVNGSKLVCHTEPIQQNDRVLVPLRSVSEALGAAVGWEEETQKITIVRRGSMQELILGQTTAKLTNDAGTTEQTLDVAPFTMNDYTLVPIRYVAESFDAQVGWDEETKTVTVTTQNPVVLTINGIPVSEGIFNFFLCQNELQYGSVATEEEIIEETINGLCSDFGLDDEAKKMGITAADQDRFNAVGVTSQQEFDAAAEHMNRLGIDAEEFAQITASIANGNLVYNAKLKAVTDDEIDRYYKEQYVTAEHILLTTDGTNNAEVKKTAEGLLKKIRNGANFEELMKQYCEDPGLENNPNGYTFTKGEMVPEFEAAAFALKEGEISDLVETDYGYHILKRMPLAPLSDADSLKESIVYPQMNDIVTNAVVEKNEAFFRTLNVAQRANFFAIISSSL